MVLNDLVVEVEVRLSISIMLSLSEHNFRGEVIFATRIMFEAKIVLGPGWACFAFVIGDK